MKVFVDADVVVDLLTSREPFAGEAAAVFQLFDEGRAEGFVSALTFAHVAYLLKKMKSKNIDMALKELRQFVTPLPVEQRTIDLALKRAGVDFEDEVQAACAELSKMDCIVTRNGKDFKSASLPVYEPSALFRKI